MGAQQAKERGTAIGASMRSGRSRPRPPRDPRILGSNIFTEHSEIYNINNLFKTKAEEVKLVSIQAVIKPLRCLEANKKQNCLLVEDKRR
ncbi:hypothetical protein RR46_08412 [Papilio xuthus]|uniref:Uncharacterized protein n=1 Tax=Papilio xuthus TaxID=66420 RepID=A0A194PF41_PAPXU|nr:hypothetical protein RR46_08412 [Papilio xuthus]